MVCYDEASLCFEIVERKLHLLSKYCNAGLDTPLTEAATRIQVDAKLPRMILTVE